MNGKSSSFFASQMRLQALEPRVLLDATLGGLIDDGIDILEPLPDPDAIVLPPPEELLPPPDGALPQPSEDGFVPAPPLPGSEWLAQPDRLVGQLGEPIRGSVMLNDTVPAESVYRVEVLEPPLHGDLDLREDGRFEYRPSPGYLGRDGFRYGIRVDGELVGQARVELGVFDPNVPLPPPDQLVPQPIDYRLPLQDPAGRADVPFLTGRPVVAATGDPQLLRALGKITEQMSDSRVVEFHRETATMREAEGALRDIVPRDSLFRGAMEGRPHPGQNDQPRQVSGDDIQGTHAVKFSTEQLAAAMAGKGAWIEGVWFEGKQLAKLIVEQGVLQQEGQVSLQGLPKEVLMEAAKIAQQIPPGAQTVDLPGLSVQPPTGQLQTDALAEGLNVQLQKAATRFEAQQREIHQVLQKITRMAGCGR